MDSALWCGLWDTGKIRLHSGDFRVLAAGCDFRQNQQAPTFLQLLNKVQLYSGSLNPRLPY